MAARTRAARGEAAEPPSVVQVTGDLDIVTAPALRARLRQAAGQDPTNRVVVDLASVTFMDCSGLAPLVEAKGFLGDRLQLQAVPRPVLRILRLTGLTATFGLIDLQVVAPIEPSRAIAATPRVGRLGSSQH